MVIAIIAKFAFTACTVGAVQYVGRHQQNPAEVLSTHRAHQCAQHHMIVLIIAHAAFWLSLCCSVPCWLWRPHM